ncbi:MAG: hypothetical protein WD990_13365 [Acidimicrobiia bacterium]
MKSLLHELRAGLRGVGIEALVVAAAALLAMITAAVVLAVV